MKIQTILMIAAGLGSVLYADPMVFDRGLPINNLNNAAGSNRSNVAWGDSPTPSSGYNWGYGDDFSFGGTGQSYQITDLRVWIVGNASGDALSSIFSKLTLAGGLPGTSASGSTACASPTKTGSGCLDASGISSISTVSTDGSDPNVHITTLGAVYQSTAGLNTLYQVDFQDLNWVVQGGTLYNFFVLGVPGTVGNGANLPSPYLAASNAALSGNIPQDGADDHLWEVAQADDAGGAYTAMDQWTSLHNGWDKASDIDVQIFATPEPASVLFLGTVVFLVGSFTRRKYQQR
jgi:hypothetical protein